MVFSYKHRNPTYISMPAYAINNEYVFYFVVQHASLVPLGFSAICSF